MSIINVLNTSTVLGTQNFDGTDPRTLMVECDHVEFGDRSFIPTAKTCYIKGSDDVDIWLHARIDVTALASGVNEIFFFDVNGTKTGSIEVYQSGGSGRINFKHANNTQFDYHIFSKLFFDLDIHFDSAGTHTHIDGTLVKTFSKAFTLNGLGKLGIIRPGVNYRIGEVILATDDTRGYRLGTSAPATIGSHNDFSGDIADINGVAATGGSVSAVGPGIQTYKFGDPGAKITGDLVPKAVLMTQVLTATLDSTAPLITPVVSDGTTVTDIVEIGNMPVSDSADRAFVNISEINPTTGKAWTAGDITAMEFGFVTEMPHTVFKFANYYSGIVGYSSSWGTTEILAGNTDTSNGEWRVINIGTNHIKVEGLTTDSTILRLFLSTARGITAKADLTVEADQKYANNATSGILTAIYDDIVANGPDTVAVWFEKL